MSRREPDGPVIDAEDVTFAYDDHPVLEAVSLTIERGEYVGLIGPNGSGKTTLLKILLGLMRPDTGTARLYGQPAHRFEDGDRLGYVSQRSTHTDQAMPITVNEAVRMGRYAHRGLRRLTDEDREKVAASMERVGIADLANRRIGHLSGGQRQRVYIARALASEAELLALDEPTVGVDADSREQFYELLRELNANGITILLIEHDIGAVNDNVETVICLNRRVHHHGAPETVLQEEKLKEVYSAHSRAMASL